MTQSSETKLEDKFEKIENDLNLDYKKLENLEQELMITREMLTSLTDSLRETQRFLLKLAYNQQEISKRISMWPYISVGVDRDTE